MSSSENKKLINGRSVKSIKLIDNAVITCMENLLKQNVNFSDEEKKRILERFEQIFTAALHEHISVDGQSVAMAEVDLNTTLEVAPFNQDQKGHLNKVVYPALGHQIEDIARQRRDKPTQCAAQYGKTCLSNCQYLDRVKVTLVAEACVEHENMEEDHLLPELKETAPLTKHLTSDIDGVEERIADTMTVLSDILHND